MLLPSCLLPWILHHVVGGFVSCPHLSLNKRVLICTCLVHTHLWYTLLTASHQHNKEILLSTPALLLVVVVKHIKKNQTKHIKRQQTINLTGSYIFYNRIINKCCIGASEWSILMMIHSVINWKNVPISQPKSAIQIQKRYPSWSSIYFSIERACWLLCCPSKNHIGAIVRVYLFWLAYVDYL